MEHSLFNGMLVRDAGVSLCTDPTDTRALGLHLGTVGYGYDLRVPLQRHGNKLGVETYKPDRDEVLNAMSAHSPNVVYLNPESSYSMKEHHSMQASAISLENGDSGGEVDLRPKLCDLPLDACR